MTMTRSMGTTAAVWGLTFTPGISVSAAQSRAAAPAAPPPERIDYLTFAQGAVPVSIGGAGARLDANFEDAVRIIDGNPVNFPVVSQAPAGTDTEFVYELPAQTTFDRFAVPNILETPSPSQTFTRSVEIHGSAQSATEGFTLVASATLQTHRAKGLVTEIPISASKAVRWIRLRLVGGINVPQPLMAFEFSEIVGNGTQEVPQLVNHFNGGWRTMGLRLQLKQYGALVSGCYDQTGELSGTVSGKILRATGVSRSDKTLSTFILSVAGDGSVRGVRSDNRGPFGYYAPRGGSGRYSVGMRPAQPASARVWLHHSRDQLRRRFCRDSTRIERRSSPSSTRDFRPTRAVGSSSRGTLRVKGPTSTICASPNDAHRPSWPIWSSAVWPPDASRRPDWVRRGRSRRTTTRAGGRSTGASR